MFQVLHIHICSWFFLCRFSVFEILDAKILWTRSRNLGWFKIRGQRWFPIQPDIISVTISKKLMCSFSDIDLGKFMVIQDQGCNVGGLLSALHCVKHCFSHLIWDIYLPRSRMVHGHLRSKFMVPVDNSWVVSYSTCIDLIIVSVPSFGPFDVILITLN